MLGLFRRRTPPPAEPAPPQVATDVRIYAIGDVHGRADLLRTLLSRIEEDAAAFNDGRRPQLVLLGDYIDRGEQSAAVLSIVTELMKDGAVCLKGNHEAALQLFLNNPTAGVRWLDFGGLQTLASYGIAPPRGRDAAALGACASQLQTAIAPHRATLDNLKMWHESGSIVFVHAALTPGVPLNDQDETALLWGEPAFLTHRWMADITVVHGHYDGPAPVVSEGRICVDTGAYYSGCLTAIRLDNSTGYVST